MQSILPKGHLSCLSSAFRYTPAVRTNIAETFVRIRQELQETAPRLGSEPVIVRVGRPFSRETIHRALQLLKNGGLRPTPRLVHTSDL
jgi:hypothetical protein